MSTAENTTLGDFDQEPSVDVTPEKLAVYYRQFEGNLRRVSEVSGLSTDEIRQRLPDCELYGEGVAPHEMAKKLPHEIDGLDPLGCGQCGRQEIVSHPCPSCGFDPAGGAGDA